jgi:hypothetical protein
VSAAVTEANSIGINAGTKPRESTVAMVDRARYSRARRPCDHNRLIEVAHRLGCVA